ncbi:MAG: ABC-type Fe3+-hydroxamate transport system substrate-binding protein [Pseudohongiellaceae bacterium]
MFYQVWNDPLATLNADHLISDIIVLYGGHNILIDVIPLAPIVNAESVLTVEPQIIVVSGMGNDRPEWLDVWKAWQAKRQMIMVSFTIFQQIYCSAIHRGDLRSSAIVRHTFQGEGNLF